MAAGRSNIGLFVSVKKIGFNLAKHILGDHSSETKLLQNILLGHFAPDDDGDFVQVVVVKDTFAVQIVRSPRDGDPTADTVRPGIAGFARFVKAVGASKMARDLTVFVLLELRTVFGVGTVVLKNESSLVEIGPVGQGNRFVIDGDVEVVNAAEDAEATCDSMDVALQWKLESIAAF